MLTKELRSLGHEVASWVENNYGETHNHVTQEFDFETWVNGPESDQSFEYDSINAGFCDLFIYLGPSGKDAAAECGIRYGSNFAYRDTRAPMIGLHAKGEDFGLMRKMFDVWCDRYTEVLEYVIAYSKNGLEVFNK